MPTYLGLTILLAAVPLVTSLAISIRDASGTSVPLHNATHNWFALTVGSQPFRAIFDTGSPDMWIPTYTDGTEGGYNTASGVDQHFTNSATYGSGEVDSGEVYSDDVNIGGVDSNFEFYVVDRTGRGFDADSNDAVIGLTYAPASIHGDVGYFENLINQNKIAANEFMFYFGAKGTGGTDDGAEVVIGGRDSARWQGDLTFAPLQSSGYWTIAVDGLSVNGNGVSGADAFQAIVDTGTSGLIIPIAQADALHAAVPGAVKSASSTATSSSYTYPCNLDPGSVPAFTIAGTTMKLSANDFNDGPADNNGNCNSIITGGTGNGLLGVQFMRSWVPIFQWGGPTTGSEVGQGAGVSFGRVCRGAEGGGCADNP